jgi:hypothetical protein
LDLSQILTKFVDFFWTRLEDCFGYIAPRESEHSEKSEDSENSERSGSTSKTSQTKTDERSDSGSDSDTESNSDSDTGSSNSDSDSSEKPRKKKTPVKPVKPVKKPPAKLKTPAKVPQPVQKPEPEKEKLVSRSGSLYTGFLTNVEMNQAVLDVHYLLYTAKELGILSSAAHSTLKKIIMDIKEIYSKGIGKDEDEIFSDVDENEEFFENFNKNEREISKVIDYISKNIND